MKEEDDDLIHPQVPERPRQVPTVSTPEAQVQQLFQMISYQAPLPPPQMLEAYERILPGSAERIFLRMEREGDHRHWMEKSKLEANIRAQNKAQWFGFIIALVGALGGFALIWKGISVIGLSIFILTMTGFAGLFVYGKRQQSQMLTEQLKRLGEIMARAPAEPREADEPTKPPDRDLSTRP